jgi:hypothetical protein
MKRIFIITVLFILSCASFLNAKNSKPVLLRDGLLLQGATGKITGSDSNDTWFFEFSSSISDNGFIIEAGTKLQLLPSSALEKMIDNTKSHAAGTFQLWNAKVTKYKGKNYLFTSVFIPVNPPANPGSASSVQRSDFDESSRVATQNTEPNTTNEETDMLFLPPEVRKKLNAAQEKMLKSGQRTPDSNAATIDNVQQEIEKIKRLNTDTVILDNAALFSQRDKEGFEFVLDSIGRNINKTSFRLLPCEVLEETQAKQTASPEPLRFKISGIVTKYKGDNYLLLYKAVQIYSFGNFPG